VPADRPEGRPDELPRGWPPGFANGAAERRALMMLAHLRTITPASLRALAWRRGTATAAVAAVADGEVGSDGDRGWVARVDPDAALRAVEAVGGRFLAPGEPGFPPELDDLHDPPGWLFLRGRPPELGELRVAIVGSRRCSPLGREIARDIGRRLAGAGVSVVSGAAHGIDAAAHRGALAAPGSTIAVLGCGLDVRHPPSSRGLIDEIGRAGCVVSEYPPGTPPEPRHFPARNRIVAALASALVVVEGASRSGSRISVEHALDLGRDVFAVPGPVTSPLAETPLELIREGATMIRDADDLLDDLGVGARLAGAPPVELPEEERRAFDAVVGSCLPDAIARVAGLSVPAAVSALVGLELRGLVRARGGRYERTLGAGHQPADA
jgi:DNA processing protein